MHVHTQGVSRERQDIVRGAERCWIDGDLIRLSSWPIGGVRPGGRSGPVPWLMDLSVLEEAMQEVYGRGFRLGDRAPLLQMTANALASGDRRRAADLANEISFPPPEYASRLRDAGLRYLNWGPAHRRGNPPIDVEAWLERKAWERKYDPNQPRVPRGHPDGGQWTDGGGAGSDGADNGSDAEELNLGDAPLSEEQYEKALEIDEEVRRVLADKGNPDALRLLAAGGRKKPPGTLAKIMAMAGPATEALSWLAETSQTFRYFYLLRLIGEGFGDLLGYISEAEEWGEIVAEEADRDFDSASQFKKFYEAKKKLGREWHHIVEDGTKFPEKMKQNTKNIVQIPRAKHWEISKFYSTPNHDEDRFGGLSPREWLRDKPIEVHRELGMEILRRFRGVK